MAARLPKSQSRKLIVPEVIQSSAMDCGPAALKSLLGGYEIEVSYGRLREACQTDVDGTSIDSIELMAQELGLEAEQIMIPRDHLLVNEARTLPAIVVTRLPNGSTHFVVVWRRHGQYLQVMDPSIGRRWVRAREFLNDLYIHEFRVPAAGWREWAQTDEFVGALVRRLDGLGLGREDGARLVDAALQDKSWRAIATLDAATRMADALARAGGIERGPRVISVIEAAQGGAAEIPPAYWSVRGVEPAAEGGRDAIGGRRRGGADAHRRAVGESPRHSRRSERLEWAGLRNVGVEQRRGCAAALFDSGRRGRPTREADDGAASAGRRSGAGRSLRVDGGRGWWSDARSVAAALPPRRGARSSSSARSGSAPSRRSRRWGSRCC